MSGRGALVGSALALAAGLLAPAAARGEIRRVWLGHRSATPTHLVVSWETDAPGDSVVTSFRRAGGAPTIVRRRERVTLHQVEIPLPAGGGSVRYQVATGAERSEEAVFKGYAGDLLRVAVVANWARRPPLGALARDDVHLLLSAGDNVEDLHGACGPGVLDCTRPYAALVDTYPALFRSVPFLPALGNHDREIRPRGPRPPPEPVYDVEATAFRKFFALPGEEWRWTFDLPRFDLRFVALDLNHVSDMGTTWQSCHPFAVGSPQFAWYRGVMEGRRRHFVATVYNEKNARVRGEGGGAWKRLLERGTVAISGFGHLGEWAVLDGLTYYNTSVSGAGQKLLDPVSGAYFGVDNYLLLEVDRRARTMTVTLKGLDGAVLDRRRFGGARPER